MNLQTLTSKHLAKYLDHTLLYADTTEEQLIAFCEDAKQIDCAMVAVNSSAVKICKEQLKNTDIHVGASISFPLGQTTIAVKVYEIKQAILDGADEIDYVLNIGKVKAHDYKYIKEEMQTIVHVCREANIISKVIFENCYLEKEEIRQCCLIAKEVKPDYIKTSTGFGSDGARVEDVKLMINTVAGEVKVKAAGKIRDWETCKTMLELGAERIGTRSSVKILEGFEEQSEGE